MAFSKHRFKVILFSTPPSWRPIGDEEGVGAEMNGTKELLSDAMRPKEHMTYSVH